MKSMYDSEARMDLAQPAVLQCAAADKPRIDNEVCNVLDAL